VGRFPASSTWAGAIAGLWHRMSSSWAGRITFVSSIMTARPCEIPPPQVTARLFVKWDQLEVNSHIGSPYSNLVSPPAVCLMRFCSAIFRALFFACLRRAVMAGLRGAEDVFGTTPQKSRRLAFACSVQPFLTTLCLYPRIEGTLPRGNRSGQNGFSLVAVVGFDSDFDT